MTRSASGVAAVATGGGGMLLLRITGGGGIGWEEAGFFDFFWAADLGLSSFYWGDFCFLVVAAGSGAF